MSSGLIISWVIIKLDASELIKKHNIVQNTNVDVRFRNIFEELATFLNKINFLHND